MLRLFQMGIAISLTMLMITSCQPVHIELPAKDKDIPQWEYTGEYGPEHWGEIDPSNLACVNGKEQSPIQFDMELVKQNEKLQPVNVYYQKSEVGFIHNGHTVQANLKDNQNTYSIDGEAYRLRQLHFHTPSEHRIGKRSYEMEMHLVHSNEMGKLAVIGVMIKAGKKAHPELQKLWAVMPGVKMDQEFDIAQKLDIKLLLPEVRTTYRYQGSLTTPPCTEGVSWTVFTTPIEMSRQQIDQFKKLFPDNHRPIQKPNGRVVDTEPVKEDKK